MFVLPPNYVRTLNNAVLYPHFKIFPVNTKIYTMFIFCNKTSSSCIRFAPLSLLYIYFLVHDHFCLGFLSRSFTPNTVHRFGNANAICDSVVVMVEMCNIMFYKIVLLSSGHRMYKLAVPRKKKKNEERKQDISDWENEPANKLLTTESTNIQTNRKTFSFLIFRSVYFMCIAFIGDFLFPMLIYLINSALTSARPLCSSHLVGE